MSALCILSSVPVSNTFCTILPFESEFYHRYRVQNFGFKTEKRTSQEEAKEEARCHTPPVSRFCYLFYTGVLISPQPDQEGNKLQRQKILIFIYPIYKYNLRNISTIYICI
jgi:hypothetical protein